LLEEQTLLQTDLSSSTGLPVVAIDLQTPVEPLLYDVVLLPADTCNAAIKAAVASNVVSASVLDNLDAILRGLGRLKDEAQKYKDSNGTNAIPAQIQTALQSGQAGILLDALSKDAGGSLPTAMANLQNALSASTPQSDVKQASEKSSTPPIIASGLPSDSITTAMSIFHASHEQDLLKVDHDQLMKHFVGASTHHDANAAQSHAAAKVRALEQKYPTTAFAASLGRDSRAFPSHHKELLSVFEKHPNMNFSNARVKDVFPNKTSSSGSTGSSGAKDTFLALQRLYKVSPKYDHVKALMDNGVRSATKIKSIGQAKLTEILKDGDKETTTEEAQTVFNRATNVAIAASLQAGNLISLTSATRIAALNPAGLDLAAVTDDFPNLKSLFQIGDFCACSDCRTVHSAAAYVADTLHFLTECKVTDTVPVPGQPARTAKQVLFDRRPDLGDMDLSCDNTNITLPYIDVACELLEDAIAPDPGIFFAGTVTAGAISRDLLSALNSSGLPFSSNAKVYDSDPSNAAHHDLIVRDTKAVAKLRPNGSNGWQIFLLKQTYGPQDQVEAMPQYVNEAAYQKLEVAQYAFSLPFSLSHQECLAYFTQFNISRADLMLALQTTSSTDQTIAGEVLALVPAEFDLVATSRPNNSQNTFWGVDPSSSAADEVSNVENFVNKTGLSYSDLENLLTLSWINPSSAMFISHSDNTCNLSSKTISKLDKNALDRFHRFIRLMLKTSIAASTLDRMIRVKKLGNGSLDGPFLTVLSQIVRLRTKLNLSWDQLSYIFDVLSTEGDSDSPYNRVFLNKTANGVVDDSFTPANLAANEDAANHPTPGVTPKQLSDFEPYLALCLGVSLADIAAILALLGADLVLSLANVSSVWALVQLARAMRLKIGDLCILLELTKFDILSSPKTLLHFLDFLATYQTSGITASDLQYYLLHVTLTPNNLDLTDSAIRTMLKTLQSSYAAAAAQFQSPFDPKASAAINEGAVVDMLSKAPPLPISDPSTATPLSPTDIAAFKAMFEGVPWTDATQTADQFINATLGDHDGTIKNAQHALATAPPNNNDAEKNALLKAVADLLSAEFIALAKDTALQITVGNGLKMSDDLVSVLLQYAMLTTPTITVDTPVKTILEADFVLPPDPSLPVPDDQARALRLIQMMNKFISAMGLSADGVKWMLINNAKLGWMRLDQLRYQDDVPAVQYGYWNALQSIFNLIQKYPPVQNPVDPTAPFSVYGLFDLVLSSTATAAGIAHHFAQLTGLDETALTDLATLFGYNNDLAEFQIGANYQRLQGAADLLRQLAISVAQAQSVIAPNLTPDDATLLRQALKARYDDSDWVGVLKPLQDQLRKQKRDALVNYILAANPLPVKVSTADDLYDYFLIDVQMGSCMDTSRVVQAHATIQLFVQRCFLGLETHSVASEAVDPKWAEWKMSMANYRLWELSKKLFLWPHAYLDQGTRQDKSELFDKFESSLNQDQLTDDVVTSAFATYLSDLQQIEQLDVLCCYYQTDILAMHVFACSKANDPPTYYHRMFNQERSWTPWQTVNVDITGFALMAFDRNSRLTLAWPIFTEEPDPAQSSQGPAIPVSSEIKDPGQPTDKVRKRWKIQLAVSELVDGNWTAKKVSRDALYYPQQDANPAYIPVDELENDYSQDNFAFFPYSGTQLGQAVAAMLGAYWLGAFALTGCSGYPEATQAGYDGPVVYLPQFEDTTYKTGRWWKNGPDRITNLGMRWIGHMQGYQHLLDNADPSFVITYPLQIDLVDTVIAVLVLYLTGRNQSVKPDARAIARSRILYQFGTFMPFFYGNSNRTYTIIPGWYPFRIRDGPQLDPTLEKTYSDLYTLVDDAYNLVTKWLTVFKNDPNKDVNKLLQEIQADPDYKALLDEYHSFTQRGLGFRYKFRNFYHPLVCDLRIAFNKNGIPGLMDRTLQLKQTTFDFSTTYKPTTVVLPDYPVEDLDFDTDGAYAGYNWELFFHSVYEVAQKLNQDQRFDQAQNWFHYIFNPLGTGSDPVPQRYWVTKPFQLRSQSDYYSQLISTILGDIAADPDGNNLGALQTAVEDWRKNPFDPWGVARNRTVEYQTATVLAYVKNLIDWGDSLFRQFTREAITEATQLYILANKLLGPKPRIVPPAVATPTQSYNELEAKMDITGNAQLDLENLLPDLHDLPHGGAELPPLPYTSLYFCIPPDDNLLSYWDLVDDRLTKIRTCRNIDGVEAHLALFSPPIDFGALSRALAGGLDVSAFLSGLGASLPNYRFQVMVSKASEVASNASSFGSSLLMALEKSDAEALARLQSTDRRALLKALRQVKQDAVDEAQNAVDGLSLTKAISQTKYDWYNTQDYMNSWEITATTLSGVSLLASVAIAVGYAMSGGLKLIPNFMAGGAGFGGSPTVNVTMGGSTVGNGAEMAARTIETIANASDKAASMATVQAGYCRRMNDWNRERDVANDELADIDGKITTAKAHHTFCQDDLTAHDQEITNAKAEYDFLYSKYTNQELYNWMVTQTSQTYLAAYKLAFDMAKKAERCYQLEIGSDATFISYGFDTLKKGLTAADALQASLSAMQSAYLDNNKREYELTKHVSMRQLDPRSFLDLKATGKCTFQIPEAMFDLDYPGHYMRRHKNVSITIPHLTTPYATACCKLTLINSRYRRVTDLLPTASTPQEAYDESTPNGGDQRFMYNVGPIQSVATSTCQDDSGLFEVNFHDERYLPFEGTGPIATWQLEIPSVFPQFDLNTISDVILHIRYTARDGGSALADAVRAIQLDELNGMLNAAKKQGLFQMYALPQMFSSVWNQLLTSVDNKAVVKFPISSLPFFTRKHGPTIDQLMLFVELDTDGPTSGGGSGNLPSQVQVAVNGEAPTVLNPDPSGVKGRFSGSYSGPMVIMGTEFTLQLVNMSKDALALLRDMVILVHYSLTT
jgi:hypothetical protein